MKKTVLALVAAMLALAAATAGASAQGSPARDHLFVGFAKAPGAAERALVQRHGGTVRFAFPSVNALAVDLDSAKVSELARAGGVRYVEQDPVRTPLGLNELETTQLVPSLTNGLYGLLTTNSDDAQAAGYTGDGVKACVADTGLDTGHPDIAPNLFGEFDAFDGDGNVDVFDDGVAETETHGTHVAGTVLGADNGVGILGVAPAADLYHARVLGTQTTPRGVEVSGTTSQVMAGVRWLADQGCDVINMSLGGGTKSRTEEALYNEITAAGTLIVVAAGNESRTRISYPGAYPVVMSVAAVDVNNELADFSNTGTGLDISAPGVGVLSSVPAGQGRDAFVTAGSTDFSGIGVEFAGLTSSTGITGTLHSCGFGESVASCPAGVAGNIALIQRGSPTNRSVTFATKVANAMAAGAVGAILYNNVDGPFSATLGTETNGGTPWIPAISLSKADGETLLTHVGQGVTLVNAPTRWDHFSGTSMATPHVAGVAALVLDANPSLTVAQLENVLKTTAADLGTPGYDTTFGHGLVDAAAATAAAAATP